MESRDFPHSPGAESFNVSGRRTCSPFLAPKSPAKLVLPNRICPGLAVRGCHLALEARQTGFNLLGWALGSRLAGHGRVGLLDPVNRLGFAEQWSPTWGDRC